VFKRLTGAIVIARYWQFFAPHITNIPTNATHLQAVVQNPMDSSSRSLPQPHTKVMALRSHIISAKRLSSLFFPYIYKKFQFQLTVNKC